MDKKYEKKWKRERKKKLGKTGENKKRHQKIYTKELGFKSSQISKKNIMRESLYKKHFEVGIYVKI